MFHLDSLFTPSSLTQFVNAHFLRAPFAAPYTAEFLRERINWQLVAEVIENGADDCWFPKEGRLPEGADGKVTIEQAVAAFKEGRTVLLRRVERRHEEFLPLLQQFENAFDREVDMQVYVTPASNEGLAWHRDNEEVFVFQSSGEKEFFLHEPCLYENFGNGRKLHCLLKGGDFLYIPAGWWHKARAVTDSFHLSVGVHWRNGAALRASNPCREVSSFNSEQRV